MRRPVKTHEQTVRIGEGYFPEESRPDMEYRVKALYDWEERREIKQRREIDSDYRIKCPYRCPSVRWVDGKMSVVESV